MKAPRELAGLRVVVEAVTYQPEAPTPPDRPHCFVYEITIHNDSDRTVRIQGRKWIVETASGETEILEGDGVEPGETFSYSSYHLLSARRARAYGSYLGSAEDAEPVVVRIPEFWMAVPGKGGATDGR